MSIKQFWKEPNFWPGVRASLAAAGIWYVGGRVLSPLWGFLSVSFWPGIGEWIHEAGWLAFLITIAIILVTRRPTATLGKLTKGLIIHLADYGTDTHNINVTAAVKRLVHEDTINAQVTNESMGGDPVPGTHKRLRVAYCVRGLPNELIEVSEGGWLRIP